MHHYGFSVDWQLVLKNEFCSVFKMCHLYKHTCIFIKYALLNIYFRLKSNGQSQTRGVDSFKMTWEPVGRLL
jgi:hypothetical protein